MIRSNLSFYPSLPRLSGHLVYLLVSVPLLEGEADVVGAILMALLRTIHTISPILTLMLTLDLDDSTFRSCLVLFYIVSFMYF